MRDHHSHREHADGRDGFEKRPGPGRERGGRSRDRERDRPVKAHDEVAAMEPLVATPKTDVVEEAPREEAVVTQVAQPVEPATPARRQRQPVAAGG